MRAFLAFLLQVLALVALVGLVRDDADLPAGRLLDEAPGGLIHWISVTRNSVDRVTLEISEVVRIAAMKKAAILTPSGRSRMFATVV